MKKKGGQRERPDKRLVIGRNAVHALLADTGKEVGVLYVASEEKGRAADLIQKAQKRKIEICYVSKRELSHKAGSDSHQGFGALIEDRALGTRQQLLDLLQNRDRFFLVATDGVTDPQNLGAILRACECFAVDGVLWSKNRSSGITPVVSKVAVGATELLDLFEVSNLADTLLAIEKETGASIICADGSEKAEDLKDFKLPDRAVLVLGAEGDGVSDLILRRAAHKLKIPMFGKIDCLNVSQAAAVLLYALRIK